MGKNTVIFNADLENDDSNASDREINIVVKF
jgi:hypothetical protein